MGKFKAFIALSLIALGYGSALAALSSQDRAQIPTWQLIVNPGFESGTAGWVASGGTFTTTSTAANVGSGLSAGSWDSSAASQTLTGAAITIPAGAYGRPAILSCNIQTPSGTATHKIQAYDGTNVLAEGTIQSSTQYRPASVMFQMPGSGSIRPRLISVASNEPLIHPDDCVLQVLQGDVVVPVAQASLYGSLNYAATLNCTWPNTNTSYTDFPFDNDCSTPTVTGFASAPGTKIPGVTFTSLPPGEYLIMVGITTSKAGGPSLVGYRWHDGTSSGGDQFTDSTASSVPATITGRFNYSTAQSNITFRLQGFRTGGTSVQIGNEDNPLQVKVYRFPSSSEMAVRPDQTDYGWTAYTPTFEGLGTVSGVKVYHRRVGENLEVNGYFKPGTTTATPATISLPSGLLVDGTKITNTTSTAWVGWANQMTTSGTPANFSATNRFHIFYDGSTGGKLFLAVQAGTSEFTKNNGSSLYNSGEGASFFFSVPIQGWKVTSGAPLLIGSVTSNSTGMERVERACISGNSGCTTACTGSPCTISRQSGSWLSSVVRNSTGNYTATIVSGIFSQAPSCVITLNRQADIIVAAGVTSSTNIDLLSTARASGTQVDEYFNLICMGPR